MEIQFKGKTYQFNMYGTVGVMLRASRLLPLNKEGKRQEILFKNPDHILLMLYVVFLASNPGQKDVTSYEDFEVNLTSENMTAMQQYFFRRFGEIEPKQEEKPTDEPKND